MPGTTSEYGFPYPIGSDPLGDGDNEIQNLAEAVETHLVDQADCEARFVRATEQTIADSTPEVISWGAGVSDLGSQFSLDVTTVIKYEGPPRFVLWRYGVEWDGGAGLHRCVFRALSGGTPGADNFVYRQLTAPTSSTPVNDAGLVWMDTNSEWQLEVYQESGGAEDAAPFMTFKGL